MSALVSKGTAHPITALVLLALLLVFAACAGSMDEESEAVTEPGIAITAEVTGDTVTEEPVSEPEDIAGNDETPAPAIPTLPPATPSVDFGSVAYDVPTSMVRGEITQVILLVSPTEDEEEALVTTLTEELEEIGQSPSNVITATVRVARRMSANLTAIPPDAFEIVPLQSSDIQFLDEREPTKWEWTVRPLTGGTHQLSLVIERWAVIDGEPTLRSEESYRDNITVAVPPGLRVRDFAASPFGIIVLLGLVAVIGLSVVLRRRSASGLPLPRTRDETLSREQLIRAVPILADALAQLTPEQRVAFLAQAGVADVVDVDLNGSAQTVARTLLSELNRYGETAGGRPAIFLLLDYLAGNPALPRSDKATLDELRAG